MSEYIFKIKSFDPLNIQVPSVLEVSGTIKIVLPSIKVKLVDLSLGGIIPNEPHISSEGEIISYDISFNGAVETGKVVSFIVETLDQWKEMHRIYQESFNKKFLLDRD